MESPNNYFNRMFAINDTTYLSNTSSPTNYLIMVNLQAFKVNIYTGSQGNWQLVKSYLCTIGKPSTPTPKGTFSVGIKGLFFGVEKGYKCWYYTQFKGNYLFHSIIYNLNGTVRDGRLGMRLSDGCIRLAKENAKWIYDNVPKGTTVKIY
ncbi:L,D-transpeptidase [Anaeromicropila herbilytica]|uniref:L,D-TPase catalytic domain-containing protein n=1 Tax=Anaeromicropila herbilytica TaxID=2785025 RepID=A0A7R7EL65_9FIRM|nr:L,D-transpeptidase [Anaeromicropila herbilytica]BCN30793.1 hypothetical protein bsdtb5_20880 [Anaeromicropila herbilytica]